MRTFLKRETRSHFLPHRLTPVRFTETINFDFSSNGKGLIFIALECVSETWDSLWFPTVIYHKSFASGSLLYRYLNSMVIFRSPRATENLILLMVQNVMDDLTSKLSLVLLGLKQCKLLRTSKSRHFRPPLKAC